MGYVKAEEILPMEIIELIQKYVDGQSIYIPKKENTRVSWGTNTDARMVICMRNRQIYADFVAGKTVRELSKIYFLSEKSIQRIIREERKGEL